MADLNESGINNPGQSNAQNEQGVNNRASGQGHAAGINKNMAPAKTDLNWARNADDRREACPTCAGAGKWKGQFCAACKGTGHKGKASTEAP
jgi:hypothetical protein